MKTRSILLMACLIVASWLLASLIDVNAKNMSTRNYAPWNAFALAAEKEPERSWRPQVPEETAEPEEATKPDKLHTEENVMLLAKLIEAENGSAIHDETLVLTGVCVLKRVKSPHYPDTLRGVIYQEGGGGRAYATAPGLDGRWRSPRNCWSMGWTSTRTAWCTRQCSPRGRCIRNWTENTSAWQSRRCEV